MFQGMSIKHKIASLVVLALLALLGISLLLLLQSRDKFIEQRKQASVEEVNMALNYLDSLEAQVNAGALSIDEAQRLGRYYINNSMADAQNYLYVYHRIGAVIAHGVLKSDVAAREEADVRALVVSLNLTKEQLREQYGYDTPSLTMPEIVAKNNDGKYTGFAEYAYKREVEKGYRTITYWGDPLAAPGADHKLVYAGYFEPWDWVVLRGIFIEDVQAEFVVWARNIALLCALVIVCLGFCAYLIYRTIVAPLNRATELMADIAQGSGDLTHRLRTDGDNELAKLGLGFNTFVSRLETIIRQVLNTNRSVAGKANELSAMVNRTADRSKSQLAETEMLASSTTELSASLTDVARGAQDSVDSAQEANNITERATAAVSNTKTIVEELARSLTEIQSRAHEMRRHNEKVNSVIEVIRGIADQTNLLALNAAIEAARAGEQGRGFAVVADEVRNLAQKTQSSTHEINQIIEQLQSNTDQVVGAMDGGVHRSQKSVEAAIEANRLLDTAIEHMGLITQRSLEIAEAVRQQARVTDGIAESSVKIAADGKLNNDDYHQCSRVNQEVNNQLEALQQLLSQFKLSGT